LNAFTSRGLVDWLEGKLRDHGVKKVLPAADVLADVYRRAFVRQFVRSAIPDLTEQAEHRLAQDGIPEDLIDQIAAGLAKKQAEPWDRLVASVVRKAMARLGER